MSSHHLTAPISVPIYEPSPYVFHHLSFNQLPLTCQQYLLSLNITHSLTPLDTVEHHRQLCAEELSRSIQGVDTALVSKMVEARRIAWDVSHSSRRSTDWATEQDRVRVHQVAFVLLPERQGHFDRFMAEHDALVWFEAQWMEKQGRKMNEVEEKEWRDELCRPVLRHAENMLKSLGEEVMYRLAAQSDAPHWKQRPLAVKV